MARLATSVLIVAMCASACASTPSSTGTLTETPSQETTSSAEPKSCPDEGCPVPDCRGDVVISGQIDHAPDAIGVEDVETDVKDWLREIGGAGDVAGLPTPYGTIAFLASRDGTDEALLWYVSDDHDGWLRDRYVGCESALEA